MRENGSSTTWVSESQRAGSSEFAPARFFGASADGSRVFFSSTGKLTNDSTASANGADLYEYDVPSGALTDLTVDQGEANGAAVQGFLEYSNDGQYMYFVALGRLVAGHGTSGQPNLYLAHNGHISFIATLDPNHDQYTWEGNTIEAARSAISASGHRIAFISDARLTADENAGHDEIYLYDADSERLICVSCSPSGLPSNSDANLGRLYPLNATDRPTNLSADGRRLFFDTADALTLADTNGQEDVYEWQEGGSEGCVREEGCVHLISGGKGGAESIFLGAGSSGRDAFFMTRDQLVGQDTDTRTDLYDARAGGGFPQPPSRPEPCSDEGCRPSPSPSPLLEAPGTIAFEGPGNLTQAQSTRAIVSHKKSISRKPAHRKRRGSRRHAKRNIHDKKGKR